MRHGTFIYDDNAMAIEYICRHKALSRPCSEICPVVQQDMLDWANGLGRVARGMLGKRNILLGGDADIELLAKQRNGH